MTVTWTWNNQQHQTAPTLCIFTEVPALKLSFPSQQGCLSSHHIPFNWIHYSSGKVEMLHMYYGKRPELSCFGSTHLMCFLVFVHLGSTWLFFVSWVSFFSKFKCRDYDTQFFLVKSLGARRFLLLTLELRNLSCDIRLWTVLTELHVQPFIMVWNLPGVSVGILSVIIYL